MTELRLALATEGTLKAADGTEYRIGQTNVEVIDAWQNWLAEEAYLRTMSSAGKHVGNQAVIKAIVEMTTAGAFDFYGDASQKRLLTPKGMKQLIFLKVAQHHPTVEKAIIEKYVDDNIEEFIRRHDLEIEVQKALDPNADAPATTGAK